MSFSAVSLGEINKIMRKLKRSNACDLKRYISGGCLGNLQININGNINLIVAQGDETSSAHFTVDRSLSRVQKTKRLPRERVKVF